MICAKPLPKVLVIEALQLMGKGLCELLARSGTFEVIGDCTSVAGIADQRGAPDLIMLDIDAMVGDVTDAIRSCKAAFPEARVCALSAFGQEEIMQRCLAAGADGFVVKDATPAEFYRAARLITEGTSYVDPRVAGNLLRRRSVANWHSDPDELSQREIEIVCLIANGMSNRDISDRLDLSEKTVKNYISKIFSKMHITARTQAAAYAFKSGLV